MSGKFKAGDKVWAICSRPDLNLVGRKAGVVIKAVNDPLGDYVIHLEEYPEQVINGKTIPWSAWERNLYPRDEGYDGNKAGEWDLCPWKPGKIKELDLERPKSEKVVTKGD